MDIFDSVKNFLNTTPGQIGIVVVIFLVLMFAWSRVESMAPSVKDRIFGVIPANATLPLRRTY